MASQHSKIKRSINEIKKFLEYYGDDYFSAYKNIRPGEGYNFGNFSNFFYKLITNLYGNLYEDLLPMLDLENPATDEEILSKIDGLLLYFESCDDQFQKVYEKNDGILLVEGMIYDLVYKARMKLKEAKKLAEQDQDQDQKYIKSGIEFDVGIIATTTHEFEAIKECLSERVCLKKDPNDSSIYFTGLIEKNGEKLKTVLSRCSVQGMCAAAVTTTKLILKFRPKIVCMAGYLAGNRNLKNMQKLGHILIGDMSIDYQQVEVIEPNSTDSKIIEKDRKKQIPIDNWLRTKLADATKNEELLSQIKSNYPEDSIFPNELKAWVGPIVSGSALMRSESRYQEIISENPGMIGLDMETHGFYYACQNTVLDDQPLFFSAKSISDFGEKRPKYEPAVERPFIRQKYASYTSAMFVISVVFDLIEQDDKDT